MSSEADRHSTTPKRRKRSFLDRVQARLGGGRTEVTSFVYQPEPQRIGSYARGKQMAAGTFRFAGHLVKQPDTPIWNIAVPDAAFAEELHGFTWLDDLAAAGGGDCRRMAQAAVMDWIEHYGAWKGAGWSPDQTGRRLIRWITHALFLMNGQTSENNGRYFRSLGHQATYLSRRWPVATAGLPRFEALTGLLYAGLSLSGLENLVAPAIKAIGQECRDQIDEGGGIASRNPEELKEIFTLLNWSAQAIEGAGRSCERSHIDAIGRIAPTLRALRHADGSLPRFHGGGRGGEGQLEHELASAKGDAEPSHAAMAMGYAKLCDGSTSVVVDADSPPRGKASRLGHASTLGLELTSNRQPVIVNCGSGVTYGTDWARAGRATQSHSTLCIDGVSSAQLHAGPEGETLTGGPRHVVARTDSTLAGHTLLTSHDAYRKTYGLTHIRQLTLNFDGTMLKGHEALQSLSAADKHAFDLKLDEVGFSGIPFSLRFHLHPEVEPSIDMGGKAVSLQLRNGETWVMRMGQPIDLRIEPSVFLEKGRLEPRPCQQIVLSSRVIEYGATVSWSLAKAKDF